MKSTFRLIAESELDENHQLYIEVFAWLTRKGVRQWLRPLSREVFAERQHRGELFGQFLEDRLAATVTLALKSDPNWREMTGTESQWWIESLAVARRNSRAGIGAEVVRNCEATVKKTGASAVWLDCVDVGFLPQYYRQLDYVELGRKTVTYPSGNSFPMVIMRKELGIKA